MITPHPEGTTLSDYADNALAPAARAGAETHMASCAECRLMVEGLRQVQAAARGLAPLSPRPEAWHAIERSLVATRAARRPARWTWLAAAAALIFATAAGVRIVDILRRPAPAASMASPDTVTAESVEAELLQAEQHYEQAIAGLEQLANADKGSLDPQTASTLEKNLAVIDQAISESRAALRAQPTSEPAQASLLEGFNAKLGLLQETVALINTEKGT